MRRDADLAQSELKYKSCPPAETVARIRRILHERGIAVDESWVDSGVEDIASVRIHVRGTDVGQNGKGTNREFAAASGYAEFMERLATGYLLPERLTTMHDRQWLSVEEVVERGGDLLRGSCEAIREQDGALAFLPLDVEACVRGWSYDARADGRIAAIPFRTLDGDRPAYLPENMLRAYYFTNGSCAGNRRDEALVQGLSELCERYATRRIIQERLTPPRIPDETLAAWPALSQAVESIRAREQLDLTILDASLGMGLPVVAALLVDRSRAKVALRFGAHPRFEIAVERCLTEILQGRHIERLENVATYDVRGEASAGSHLNYFNLIKTATGVPPAELFLDSPSWVAEPCTEAPASIEGQLDFLVQLFGRLGWEVYVRDCSQLGFPVYQIVVPGVSMAFDFGSERLRERRSIHHFRQHALDLAHASADDLAKVRRLMLYKRPFILENSFAFLTGLPLRPGFLGYELDATALAALCALALGDRQQAAELLRQRCFTEQGELTRYYPLVQLLEADDAETAYQALARVCPEGWVAEARQIVREPARAFPRREELSTEALAPYAGLVEGDAPWSA